MNRVGKIIVCLCFLCGCGGGGDDGRREDVTVKGQIPQQLSPYSDKLMFSAQVLRGSDLASPQLSPTSDGMSGDGGITFTIRPIVSDWRRESFLHVTASMIGDEGKPPLVLAILVISIADTNALNWADARMTAVDGDGDGLSSLAELELGLDPRNADSDGDGIVDGADPFPSIAAEDFDRDDDGVHDSDDNCPDLFNADQLDRDRDGRGDVCDDYDAHEEEAVIVDFDLDDDGVEDDVDNCPRNPNSDQDDIDGDGIGDACDDDIDGDGVANAQDRCPERVNTVQGAVDGDGDGISADCDLDDGDALLGDGRAAIFVSAAFGDDAATGSRLHPLSSVREAMRRAVPERRDVIVAGGEYDVGSVIFGTGVRLFGGLREHADSRARFIGRDVRSRLPEFRTAFVRADAGVTLLLSNVRDAVLSGVHIVQRATARDIGSAPGVLISGGNPQLIANTIETDAYAAEAISVELRDTNARMERNYLSAFADASANSYRRVGLLISNSAGALVNNIIEVKGARFVTGVEVEFSRTTLVNNTIMSRIGSGQRGTAEGVLWRAAWPMAVNNLIVADGNGDRLALSCEQRPLGEAGSKISHNLLALPSANSSAWVASDCDGNVYTSSAFAFSGAAVNANNAVLNASGIEQVIGADFIPLMGIGAGASVSDGAPVFDYYGRARGALVDIGAVER